MKKFLSAAFLVGLYATPVEVKILGAGVPGGPPPAAPVNVTLPEIQGLDTVGSSLSVNNALGTWLNSPTSYTCSWHFIGGSSLGTNCSNFGPLVSGQLGNRLQVDVTATNAGGSATATSNFVGPIETNLPLLPFMLLGTGFGATQGGSTVTIGGTNVTSITSWSNTQIVGSIPAGAPKTPTTSNTVVSTGTLLSAGSGALPVPTTLPVYPANYLENGHAIYPGCDVPPIAPTAGPTHTWYIDPIGGNDTNTGHSGSAWQHFGIIFGNVGGVGPKFPATVTPGDTIYVKPAAGSTNLGPLNIAGYSTTGGTTDGTTQWTWIMKDPAAATPPIFSNSVITGGVAGFIISGVSFEDDTKGSAYATQGQSLLQIGGSSGSLSHDIVVENSFFSSWHGHAADAWPGAYPSTGGSSNGTIVTASPYTLNSQDPTNMLVSATTGVPTKLFIQNALNTSILSGRTPPFNYVFSPGYFYQQNLPPGGAAPTNTGIPNGTIIKNIQGIAGLFPAGNDTAANIVLKPEVDNNAWFATDTLHMYVGVSGSWVDEGLGYVTIGTCDPVADQSTGCPSTNTNNGTPFAECDPLVGGSGGCPGGTWPTWTGVTRNLSSEYVVLVPAIRVTPNGNFNNVDWPYASNGIKLIGAGGSNNTDPANPNDLIGVQCISAKGNLIRDLLIGITNNESYNVIDYNNKISYMAVDAIEVFSSHRNIEANNLITNMVYGVGHQDMIQFATDTGTENRHYIGNTAVDNEGYTFVDSTNQFPTVMQGIDNTDEIEDGTYVANNIVTSAQVNSMSIGGTYNAVVHNDVFHNDAAAGYTKIQAGSKTMTNNPSFSLLANNVSHAMLRLIITATNNTGVCTSGDGNTVETNMLLPVINSTTGGASVQNSDFCGVGMPFGSANFFNGVGNGNFAGVFPDMYGWTPTDWRTEQVGVTSPFKGFDQLPQPIPPTGFPFPGAQYTPCVQNEFTLGNCPSSGVAGILNLRPNSSFVGTATTGYTGWAKIITDIPTTGTIGNKWILTTSAACNGGFPICGASFASAIFPPGIYTRINSNTDMTGYGAVASPFNANNAPFTPGIIGAGTSLGSQAPPANHGRQAWTNPPNIGAY